MKGTVSPNAFTFPDLPVELYAQYQGFYQGCDTKSMLRLTLCDDLDFRSLREVLPGKLSHSVVQIWIEDEAIVRNLSLPSKELPNLREVMVAKIHLDLMTIL